MPKTITICSSANFYQYAHAVRLELEKAGFRVEVPVTLNKMKRSGNFDAAHYRIWLKDPGAYKRKTYLMRNHFDKIAKSDAILVVNDKKKGIEGYIGGNVLMEMGLAFHLKIPIFVLNNVSPEAPFYEEIRAMNSRLLNGDITKVKL